MPMRNRRDDDSSSDESSYESASEQDASYSGKDNSQHSSDEESESAHSEGEYSGSSQPGSYDDEEGSGSYEESNNEDESQSGSYEEGSQSGSYYSQDGGSRSGSYEEEEDGEQSHSGSEEREDSQSGSYDDEDQSQSGSYVEDDGQEESQSASDEEASQSDSGSAEEEESENGSCDEEVEQSQSGSYSGSEEAGSQSGSYEDNEELSQSESNFSGSQEEDSGSSNDEEEEKSQSGSYSGSQEEDESRSGSYDEDEEQSRSGSEEELDLGSRPQEEDEPSQSGSYDDEDASQSQSQNDESSGSGSHGDSQEPSHSGSYHEEGSFSGSHSEEASEPLSDADETNNSHSELSERDGSRSHSTHSQEQEEESQSQDLEGESLSGTGDQSAGSESRDDGEDISQNYDEEAGNDDEGSEPSNSHNHDDTGEKEGEIASKNRLSDDGLSSPDAFAFPNENPGSPSKTEPFPTNGFPTEKFGSRNAADIALRRLSTGFENGTELGSVGVSKQNPDENADDLESKGAGSSLFDNQSQSMDSFDSRVEAFGQKEISGSLSGLAGRIAKDERDDGSNTDGQSVGSHRSSSSRLSVSKKRSAKKDANKRVKNRPVSAYTREEMTKLAQVPRDTIVLYDNEEDIASEERSVEKKKTRKKRQRIRVKSEALLELATSINGAMIDLEKREQQHEAEKEKKAATSENSGLEQDSEEKETKFSANQVMYSFEVLVGILLRLSDELELLSTFEKKSDVVAIEALKTLLSYTDIVEDIFSQIQPILENYLFQTVEDEMEDFLYGMNLIVEQLCEICYHVGEKHQWNARANTSYLTLLELLGRDSLEISCIFEDIDTPEYPVTEEIQEAWEATGHDEEIKSLLVSSSDLAMFRQICYEVMLSCDQWCPDTDALMDICAIEESSVERNKQNKEDDIVSPPEGALQVLEKINGEYLLRVPTMASILRRILPAEAVTDHRMKDSFARVRSTIRNPLGLSPSTLVSISSIPEDPDDEEALGVAGVGKTSTAAMVANHQDVRRFFCDGIAWIYVGPTELNYTRYIQCLQDLISQLELEEDDEPTFPELLQVPGETKSKRRRREEGFMIFVRQMMIDFFEGLNVLIILDDVCFDPDLDWFDFTPPPTVDPEDEEGSCVVLVTSRRRNLLPDADTVEVDMLEEKEAVKLLVKESQSLSTMLKPDSPEIKTVVTECANHALAVKSVGRWLNLKHASDGVATSSADEIHQDAVRSIERILKSNSQGEADMMYEILNLSLSPAIGGEPTSIIKFCFASFVKVFCEREHISDFALADSTPIVPLAITEKLFEALLGLEEDNLKKEINLFHSENGEAASLIPQALAALGLFKVIVTFVDEDEEEEKVEEEKFVQILHKIQQEYGEYLCDDDPAIADLVKDGELRWNKALSQAFLSEAADWGTENPDAAMDYALEMMPCHMYRGGMLKEAANLLTNSSFIKGRLFALGRENGTRRHIKDTEALFDLMKEKRASGNKKMDPKRMMKRSFDALSGLLYMEEDELIAEEGSPEAVEVGRSFYDIGLSLSERRCWEAAIYYWEKSQDLFVSALGLVELVAGVLFTVGIIYAEMNDYEKSLSSLKQCLRIRGAIHGEEHILYAQTIQRIGDTLLKMSDYQEAMESYNWALDVMHIEPNHHRIDIGDVLENMGSIHYNKGEVDEALRCFQDALRSKQVDLGEDHPDLASTFHRIGDCLSDQGKTEEAIAHYEEAIRLKNLEPDGGHERDADVLTIEGILHNLHGRHKEGVESYEKALQVLVTKVPHRKEKVASLLHMIGCVYLMGGEHKRAMKLFEESLQARRKVLGYVHLDVASTLFNMAFLYQSRNRLDKALKCLEEALKIRQLRLPDTEKVAVTHEKIGNLSRALGKTKKAELAFNEALRIRKHVHGENHEAVATVLQELGDLMDDLGESDTAMKHYVLALEIRESRLGPDDLAVSETYYSMGFTLQNNDAVDRALQCFEEALSIRKFQLGDDAKEVGDTLNMMGFIQAQRGELEDAISLLWEALRIRKLQDDRVKVSETLKNIGNVHREKHEHELAIECYEECIRIRRRELGEVHEKLADSLLAMGHVQSDMNLTDEAMDSYREALTIRIRLFGEQDESVATVLQYMGTLEFRAIRLDRAYQLLDEFIRIRQDNGTEPDGDYVNVLFMIGNIHKMQGREAEAQKCWTEAYDVFQELGMADGNPQIAEVMSTLVRDDEKKSKGFRFNRNKTKNGSGGKTREGKDDLTKKKVFGALGKIKGVGRAKKAQQL